MRFIRLLIGALVTLAILLFAASNRQTVEVFLTPITPSIQLPLYLIALGLMGFGFVMGGIFVWLNEGKTRRERRKQRKEIKALQKELSAAGIEAGKHTPPTDFFPALPKRTKT